MYAKLVFQRCNGNAVDQPGFVVITLATTGDYKHSFPGGMLYQSRKCSLGFLF